MADEEAAKARMLADLGNMRRDFVSAPVELDERRARADRREQAAAQRADETRRARVEAAAAAGGANGDQAARIAAWNSEYFTCNAQTVLTFPQMHPTSSRMVSQISSRTGTADKGIASP
jgi:hypothetical protein